MDILSAQSLLGPLTVCLIDPSLNLHRIGLFLFDLPPRETAAGDKNIAGCDKVVWKAVFFEPV